MIYTKRLMARDFIEYWIRISFSYPDVHNEFANQLYSVQTGLIKHCALCSVGKEKSQGLWKKIILMLIV